MTGALFIFLHDLFLQLVGLSDYLFKHVVKFLSFVFIPDHAEIAFFRYMFVDITDCTGFRNGCPESGEIVFWMCFVYSILWYIRICFFGSSIFTCIQLWKEQKLKEKQK